MNSLSYLFLLLSKIESACGKSFKSAKSIPESVKSGSALSAQIDLFLRNFDPVQVRYSGAEWRRLIEHVAQVASATEQVDNSEGELANCSGDVLIFIRHTSERL